MPLMNGNEFSTAFNKVGYNSFSCQVPMFLGKRYGNEQSDMQSEVISDENTYYDKWQFIWKLFAEKGYATSFNEDMPSFGLFHYLTKGFMEKPFDYYYHFFWIEVTKGISGQDWSCFGNTHRARITIDLTKRHVISMKDKLQFIYSTLSELPHDTDNEIERVDEDLVKFWTELHEHGYLNKTMVVFASDHGIRYGSLRKTAVGKVIFNHLRFFKLFSRFVRFSLFVYCRFHGRAVAILRPVVSPVVL